VLDTASILVNNRPATFARATTTRRTRPPSTCRSRCRTASRRSATA
jgi:hypothetical protein